MRSFASDNNSGVHPRVMDAIIKANDNHAVGYGDDPWTEAATSKIQEVFGKDASPFFVFNGTGANSVALQAVTRPFNSILCAETAHINVDECGAPARMTGCAIVTIPTTDGKLTPELIRPHLKNFGVCHHSQPKAVYISQVSELGTIYTIEEVKAIADLLHSYDMYLHMDGALGERLRLPELHDAPSDRRRRRGYLELRRHEKRYDDGRGRGLVPPGDHGEPAILPKAIRSASLEATLSLRPVHPLSGK